MAIRPFEFPKYKAPHVAESDDGQMYEDHLRRRAETPSRFEIIR